jgi:peptide deformylase
MAVERVRVFPDPELRRVSEEVILPDESVRALVGDMFRIMGEEGGIGLAAPQVGVSKRVIVVSVEEKGFERLALINPVIVFSSRETVVFEEGCLSIPGVRADVERPSRVVVRGITRSGRLVEIDAADLLARVLQHEIDHLNGVLFIDRLKPEERQKAERDLQVLARSVLKDPVRADPTLEDSALKGVALRAQPFRTAPS